MDKVVWYSRQCVHFFSGRFEITESTGVPDASTPLLRLENEMAPITVDSLSWVRVPVDSQKDITVYIHK